MKSSNGIEVSIHALKESAVYFGNVEIAGGAPQAVMILLAPNGTGASVFTVNPDFKGFQELEPADKCIAVIDALNEFRFGSKQ